MHTFTLPVLLAESSPDPLSPFFLSIIMQILCKNEPALTLYCTGNKCFSKSNIMRGNTLHGSGMMAIHTFMGDTTAVNQCYRDLTAIRLAHPAHHAVK
jgi:hypothetical protein